MHYIYISQSILIAHTAHFDSLINAFVKALRKNRKRLISLITTHTAPCQFLCKKAVYFYQSILAIPVTAWSNAHQWGKECWGTYSLIIL
ncbi:hypothetical protein MAIT1_02984 [Magnetofaba australis IT-1]|uniref:Uncharacterized protein n=1 Tax=Magnetofaba australis IT-1 TaxID=1434232 RepID=A0A1Y2K5C6_9PROT|nr:hypothetical protein MAIT1_02984 [Magnetofaba australis IT-1]